MTEPPALEPPATVAFEVATARRVGAQLRYNGGVRPAEVRVAYGMLAGSGGRPVDEDLNEETVAPVAAQVVAGGVLGQPDEHERVVVVAVDAPGEPVPEVGGGEAGCRLDEPGGLTLRQINPVTCSANVRIGQPPCRRQTGGPATGSSPAGQPPRHR